MKRIVPVLAVLVLALGVGSFAEPPEGGGPPPGSMPRMGPLGGPGGGPHGGPGMQPFERDLYPPELVLSNQLAIGMTDEQVAALKKLLADTHTRLFDVQVDLQRAQERIAQNLKPAKVDEAAVLASADQVMALESQMKKTHLTLLVRIKNLLTEEQQAKLDSLRPHPPAPPPPRGDGAQ